MESITETPMKIKCKYDALVDAATLNPYPRNRNKHTKAQINRLAKILTYQGVRAPIIVSNLSGFIMKGHGTLMAMKKNHWAQVPVVYQDFDDEFEEYSFVHGDNSIATWAQLDTDAINMDLNDFSKEYDREYLALKKFQDELNENFNIEDGQEVAQVEILIVASLKDKTQILDELDRIKCEKTVSVQNVRTTL